MKLMVYVRLAAFAVAVMVVMAARAGEHGVGSYIPDFDRDGVRDSVAREVRFHPTELVASRVRVMSGATGEPLTEFVSPAVGDAVGWDVLLVPDIDGDAAPDLVIAAPHHEVDPDRCYGKLYAVGSMSGEVLWSNEVPESSEGVDLGFGAVAVRAGAHALGRIGDLDQDGLPDVVIHGSTTPLDADPSDPATVRVTWWAAFSSASGALLAEAHGVVTDSGLPGTADINEVEFWQQFSVPGTFEVLGGDPSDTNADGWVDAADLAPLASADLKTVSGNHVRLEQWIESVGRIPHRRHALYQSTEDAVSTQVRRLPRYWACCVCTPLCDENDEVPCGIDCEGCFTPCCADPCSCSTDPCCSDPCCGSSDPCCGSTDPCCGSEDPCCGNPDPCCIDPCLPGCQDECEPTCDSDDDGDPNNIDCDSGCPPPTARGGDEATIDLRIDCNNDGLINAIDDENEDLWPHHKLIIVNRFDTDNDQVPDFADGYGGFGPTTAEPTVGNRFTPLKLKVNVPSDVEGAAVVFLFAGAHFDEVQREVVPIPELETEAEFFTFAPRPQCAIRLWTKDGDKPRTVANSIASGQPIPVPEGCWSTLFIEVVEGDWNRSQIIAQVIDGTGTVLASDEVDILPFDPAIGLGSNIEIAGYEIIRDFGLGTDGKDIIFAPTAELVVDAGAGDDIIVVADGSNQHIITGPGSDHVFLPDNGIHELELESDPATVARTGGCQCSSSQPRDRVLKLSSQPPLNVQTYKAYRVLFGPDDPWLCYFLETCSTLDIKRGSDVEFKNLTCTGSGEDKRTIISIAGPEDDLYHVAAILRSKILELAGRRQGCGLIEGIQGRIIDDLYVIGNMVEAQLQDDEPRQTTDPLALYNQVRLAAFADASALVAYTARTYIETIRFLSTPTDLIVSVADLADGDADALVGLLPLIPSTVTGATKVIARVDDSPVLRKSGQYIEHFEVGCRSTCPIIARWKWERDMPHRTVRAVDGRDVPILGNHQTNSGNPQHVPWSRYFSETRARDGTALYVATHRTLRKMTGLDTLGEVGEWLPDVMVVRTDGRIDLYEIQSLNESAADLDLKLRRMRDALPPDRRGQIRAILRDEIPPPLE